jgi:hypothetical protein
MSVLLEPRKRETRIGWWFMRTFRRKEVAVRTARNAVIDVAYKVAFDLHETETVSMVHGYQLTEALNDYAAACDLRDKVEREEGAG